MTMTTSEYVKGKLAEFIDEYEGAEIDVDGFFGAQSPDLAAAYIGRLLGRDWIFPYPAAVDLWEDPLQVMVGNFERVADWGFETGDLAVFDKTHGSGFGTVGIITGKATSFGLEVFTQTPGPARKMTLSATSMLGAWRLSAGAECVRAYDEYAAWHSVPAPKVEGWGVWSGNEGEQLGHVEIITKRQARHYRRQTLNARLRAFFGDSK
jgi:hypothetical protein